MAESFRGDPYRVLNVARDATSAAIKRRWRELAREHHPDRAAGDGAAAARLTGRMAQINAGDSAARLGIDLPELAGRSLVPAALPGMAAPRVDGGTVEVGGRTAAILLAR